MTDATVTISADYFVEIYSDAAKRAEAVCTINALAKQFDEEREGWNKERDELKAKLDCADVDRETYKDRAEAAERCIEDIDSYRRDCDYTQEETLRKIGDVIRAYSEAKEAK